jgi:hypothetical protein
MLKAGVGRPGRCCAQPIRSPWFDLLGRASNYVGWTRFTTTGGLYPIVEMNSSYGLLVGISSGGRIRVPTGDMLWVVDDKRVMSIGVSAQPAVPRSRRAKFGPSRVASVSERRRWLIEPIPSVNDRY